MISGGQFVEKGLSVNSSKLSTAFRWWMGCKNTREGQLIHPYILSAAFFEGEVVRLASLTEGNVSTPSGGINTEFHWSTCKGSYLVGSRLQNQETLKLTYHSGPPFSPNFWIGRFLDPVLGIWYCKLTLLVLMCCCPSSAYLHAFWSIFLCPNRIWGVKS